MYLDDILDLITDLRFLAVKFELWEDYFDLVDFEQAIKSELNVQDLKILARN